MENGEERGWTDGVHVVAGGRGRGDDGEARASGDFFPLMMILLLKLCYCCWLMMKIASETLLMTIASLISLNLNDDDVKCF